jgi:hypothetical protein
MFFSALAMTLKTTASIDSPGGNRMELILWLLLTCLGTSRKIGSKGLCLFVQLQALSTKLAMWDTCDEHI